ncbi:hypothetical protein MHU86_17915 [Fragilaria crotonensis]|nr:hypothetical protein MHU86_17915 [Fragilaria crotonensis]
MLWASENGLLREIRLVDVPESTMMSHLIRGVRSRLVAGEQRTLPTGGVAGAPGTTEGTASMEMMAASSQSMVALLSRFQEGAEADRQKKDSEKSILKAMGPTQRGLFTSLCTRRMNAEPVMTEFMTNLTTSKTPQKAINLIQSETRDWEGHSQWEDSTDALEWLSLSGPEQGKPWRIHHLHVSPEDSGSRIQDGERW